MSTDFLTTPLVKPHKKSEFECGNSLLDNYLHKQANQDVKRKVSVCFILSDDTNTVKGYYTLSNSSINRSLLPEEVIKILPPSYHDLPVTLLGRLARDNRFRGEGLGELLLLDALKRSHETCKSVASFAVIVDPIDEKAVKFYSKYGFILLPSSGKMFLKMKDIAQLFE